MQQNFAMPLGLDFKKVNAQVADWKKRETEPRPPAPFVPIVCETAAEMRNYRERFLLSTNWSQKLSDSTSREFELEDREKSLLSTVDRCNDPKSNLTRSERGELLEKINGRDFPSAATKHMDHPTMIHQDGLLDKVREELAEIRKNMPMLVRSAERYLEELRHIPTERQIFEARQREREVEELIR